MREEQVQRGRCDLRGGIEFGRSVRGLRSGNVTSEGEGCSERDCT